eukprot:jgi/Undpi1/1606/HiC_scaffold_11.g04996.m1
MTTTMFPSTSSTASSARLAAGNTKQIQTWQGRQQDEDAAASLVALYDELVEYQENKTAPYNNNRGDNGEGSLFDSIMAGIEKEHEQHLSDERHHGRLRPQHLQTLHDPHEEQHQQQHQQHQQQHQQVVSASAPHADSSELIGGKRSVRPSLPSEQKQQQHHHLQQSPPQGQHHEREEGESGEMDPPAAAAVPDKPVGGIFGDKAVIDAYECAMEKSMKNAEDTKDALSRMIPRVIRNQVENEQGWRKVIGLMHTSGVQLTADNAWLTAANHTLQADNYALERKLRDLENGMTMAVAERDFLALKLAEFGVESPTRHIGNFDMCSTNGNHDMNNNTPGKSNDSYINSNADANGNHGNNDGSCCMDAGYSSPYDLRALVSLAATTTPLPPLEMTTAASPSPVALRALASLAATTTPLPLLATATTTATPSRSPVAMRLLAALAAATTPLPSATTTTATTNATTTPSINPVVLRFLASLAATTTPLPVLSTTTAAAPVAHATPTATPMRMSPNDDNEEQQRLFTNEIRSGKVTGYSSGGRAPWVGVGVGGALFSSPLVASSAEKQTTAARRAAADTQSPLSAIPTNAMRQAVPSTVTKGRKATACPASPGFASLIRSTESSKAAARPAAETAAKGIVPAYRRVQGGRTSVAEKEGAKRLRGTSGSNAVVKPTAVTEPTDMVSTARARSTDGEKQQGTARRLRSSDRPRDVDAKNTAPSVRGQKKAGSGTAGGVSSRTRQAVAARKAAAAGGKEVARRRWR